MPVWTGNGFRVGDQLLPLLSYDISPSGWTNELTAFHEETAGESHFIDRASRSQAIAQIARYANRQSPVILDIGCSSGFLLADLRTAFPQAYVMGADVVLGPLMNLAEAAPGIPLLHFDLVHCPLPDASIDAVVLLNVLEHIRDDAMAVRQLFRILKPGGIAVIEVPSGLGLFDIYDELLLHYRRYDLPGLRRLFLDARFAVLHESHLGFFLYPGFRLVKLLQRKQRPVIPEAQIPSLVRRNITQTGANPILRVLMDIELALGKIVSYPFGIRCLLTCLKPA